MFTLLVILGLIAWTVFVFKVGVQYENNRIQRATAIAYAFVREQERQERNKQEPKPPKNPWN